MKLETIKSAIREWYEINDFVDETFKLLNQGVLFKINPKVIRQSTKTKREVEIFFIHAYPGIIEGKLKFFVINSVMDNKEKFNDKTDPITNYIFVEDAIGMDEKLLSDFQNVGSKPNANITPKEAKERISQWSLAKESWIKNQINNTEGIFEAFIIPIADLNPNSDIYALFALTDKLTADLIIWDNDNNLFRSSGSELRDVTRPVPPYGDGSASRSNFVLLNESINP